MRVAKYGEPFVTDQVTNIDLGNEVYVGLFVGSHNADMLETGVFKDVRITVPFNGMLITVLRCHSAVTSS
jgi:TolB protein